MDPTLRRAGPEDAAALLAHLDAHGLAVGTTEAGLARVIHHRRRPLWIAERHGRVVGHTGATVRGDCLFAIGSAVLDTPDPSTTQGLIQAGLCWARDLGAPRALVGDRPVDLAPARPLQLGADLPEDQVLSLYNSVGWVAYTEDPAGLMRALSASTWVMTRWKGSELIALCRLFTDDTTLVWLQDLLVRPELQRTGLGRQLIDLALARFGHARQIQLLTDDRPEQHAFYRSLGFTDTRQTTLHGFVQV